MRKIKLTAGLLVVALVLYVVWTWDRTPPVISWETAESSQNRSGTIQLQLSDSGRGLRSVEVAALQSGQRQVLLSRSFEAGGWRGPAPESTQHLLAVELGSAEASFLSEGEFELEASVTDHPNLWLFNNGAAEKRRFKLDLTPPGIDVLSGRHYVRQGGAEAIVYRLSEGVRSSGVRVGEKDFVGYALPGSRPSVFLALFALSHDQDRKTPMSLWAIDRAGNRGVTGFAKEVIAVRFRRRNLNISDDFMQKVSPQILTYSKEVSAKPTLLETFLEINGRLRELNHARIADLAGDSSDRLLWRQPFLQLSNSQVEANFADDRTYFYRGKAVDRQTHLGFDLASTAQSLVECANDGRVAWADNLGIYGKTVIVDHGLGLQSLYGHLSSVDVSAGQFVERGQVLGRTGQTGLAGGDHLHFSMILQGVQVNPLEWWDPKWVEEHVFSRLELAVSEPEKN